DKGNGTLKGINILDDLEQRIENVEKHLNKAKKKMDINKGKEKMVMKKVTSDESSDDNPFQVSIDDTLKSSSKDTYEQRTVYKGRPGSTSTSATTTKLEKLKSRSRSKHLPVEKISSSKHLTPRTGSTSTTIFVPTKRPPLVRNCALGLAAVKTWQQILNKEFGIKKAKEDVGGSSDVSKKGKRKMP
ncbi:hypothetical protein Tco_0943171, partial [Tanacetum coccineum]